MGSGVERECRSADVSRTKRRSSNKRTALPVSVRSCSHWPIATHAGPLRNTLIHRHSYIHTDPFVRLSWSVVPPVRSLKIIVSHAPSPSHNYNHTVMFVLSPRTYNWWNTAVLLLLLCNCRTRKQDRLMRWNAITLQVLLQNSIKQWK